MGELMAKRGRPRKEKKENKNELIESDGEELITG